MQQKLFLGLVLTLIIVVFIPVYWAAEPGRQETARERIKAEAVGRGSELYSSHCAVCHGPGGEGKIGPALKNSPLDLNVLEKTIARGVPGKAMPAMANEEGGPLKEHQIKDLVTFVKNWDQSLIKAPSAPSVATTTAPSPAPTLTAPSVATATAPSPAPTPTAPSVATATAPTQASTATPTAALTPTQPSTPTPILSSVNAGALFAEKCAACHGAKREGISGIGPALTPESLGPLSAAKVREAITAGRLAKGMPPFKDILSPEEIDALVQFLKNVSP